MRPMDDPNYDAEDELEDELDSDLDDFESDDFADIEDADGDYLAGMWKGYRAWDVRDDAQLAAATVVAHGMVQSFINAFARDGQYVVRFDANTETAGTDMRNRNVVITPAPIADRNLTPEQAGEILTGLAVHEISHPRYGRGTWEAVQARFPGSALAFRISNLLDDIRIERRFVADYPGYAGIFKPVLDYVGKGQGQVTPRMSNLANLAVMATRYPAFADWTDATEAERTWWVEWADRWSREDAPRRHVAGVREALVHIASTQVKQAPVPTTPKPGSSPSQGGSETTQSDATDAGDETVDTDETQVSQAPKPASPDDESQDREIRAAADEIEAANADESDLPTCSGSKSVDASAAAQGTDRDDIAELKEHADQIIEAARNLQDDGHGHKVDVAQSTKGLVSGGTKRPLPSDRAARYIRNAILRSRTGNTDTTRHQQRGRLDQHGLGRIALGDTKLFERRKSPSPGKYLVWIMVDASGSMDGHPLASASQVAHAIAAASNGTPTVRMSVWAWSDPFRHSPAGAGVARCWSTGEDVNQIFRMNGLQTGGTPDATILGWAARAIKKAARPDETPVIIVASDGTGEMAMNDRVAEARRMGVKVYSVSLGWGMQEQAQIDRYGRGNYVAWAGSIINTAKPLADMFARITSGR